MNKRRRSVGFKAVPSCLEEETEATKVHDRPACTLGCLWFRDLHPKSAKLLISCWLAK